MKKLVLCPGETEKNVINIYPELRDQRFLGFGGAITEAAASTYAQMDDTQKRILLEAYFLPERMNPSGAARRLP